MGEMSPQKKSNNLLCPEHENPKTVWRRCDKCHKVMPVVNQKHKDVCKKTFVVGGDGGDNNNDNNNNNNNAVVDGDGVGVNNAMPDDDGGDGQAVQGDTEESDGDDGDAVQPPPARISLRSLRKCKRLN